jgi:hypothetical protein
MNWKGFGRKWLWPNLRCYPGIRSEAFMAAVVDEIFSGYWPCQLKTTAKILPAALAFALRDQGQPQRTAVRIVDVPPEIQADLLVGQGQKHYCLRQRTHLMNILSKI